MCCLDIVRMVIPPRSAHPSWVAVVWDYVVVIREVFMADGTYPALLNNFAVQQFSHLGR